MLTGLESVVSSVDRLSREGVTVNVRLADDFYIKIVATIAIGVFLATAIFYLTKKAVAKD